jgi:nucleoside-diphosphate-sugar epimerase
LVLGCGWLGLALARSLVAEGHRVLGTTTTSESLPTMQAAGIEAHVLKLGADFNSASEALLHQLLSAADVLVLNVPPRAAAAGAYPTLLRPVHRAVAAAGTRHVIFVSSTSVYPDEPRVMRESDAVSTRDAASDVLRAEGHFVPRYGQWKSTVVRLGGLIGPDRSPGRFLAGRRDLAQGNAPVNLVHLTDAVGVLMTIIQQGVWGHTFNVCALKHPLRKDFYTVAAQHLKLEPPTFKNGNSVSGKIIDSSLVRNALHYKFKFDDVFGALEHC